MTEKLSVIVKNWLINIGMSADSASITTDYMWFIILLCFAALSFWIARTTFLNIVRLWVRKSKTKWDDVLIEYRFFRKLAYIVPIIIIYYATPLILEDQPSAVSIIEMLCYIAEILVGLMVTRSFFDAVNHIYSTTKLAQKRSIKGFLQLLQIIIYVVAGLVIVSLLLDMETKQLLLGLGGFSAVLLLIFKDSILGFVGGLQLSANNIIMPGDWISMPEYGADGTVEDISLVTVKVRNWDKTITSLPTYNLITSPVTNWRGMEESGGRRIKRSFNIDMTSVHFLSEEEVDHLRKVNLLSDYISEKQNEIEKINSEQKVDLSVKVNGLRQTNLGAFRIYLRNYLHSRSDIHDDMTFLVRQLQPNEKGIPIEIYVFSKIQAWSAYEDIQSDITDHILASIPEFKLRIFQFPSGSDFGNFS